MQNYLIIKLDTPLTLNKQSCSVPQAEPLNMAMALLAANPGSNVYMMGLTRDTEITDHGRIMIIPVYMVDRLPEDLTVLIWQGRHCIQIVNNEIKILEAIHSDYERVACRVDWQIQMHILITTCEKIRNTKKYFVLTDSRLPLLDLGKCDFGLQPLPEDIELLSQAYKVDDMLEFFDTGYRTLYAPDFDITPYLYRFKKSQYLPLHLLPLLSHISSNIGYSSNRAIFQTQALQYCDEYRMKSLIDLINKVKINPTFISCKNNPAELHAYEVIKSKLNNFVIPNHIHADYGYFDAAKVLSNYKYSLIVTERNYQKFGLCPNRFIEAIAANVQPIVADGVLDNCDPELGYGKKILEPRSLYYQLLKSLSEI